MKFLDRSAVVVVIAASLVVLGGPRQAEAQASPRGGEVAAGTLVTALDRVNVQITRLQGLRNVTAENVRLVNVRDVVDEANAAAFSSALSRNNVEILNLRNVLSNYPGIMSALSNNAVPIAIDQVVAIEVGRGDVVVFYQPPAQE